MVAARKEVGCAVAVDDLVDEVVEHVFLTGGDMTDDIFGSGVDAVAHQEGVEVAGHAGDGAGEFLWALLERDVRVLVK